MKINRTDTQQTTCIATADIDGRRVQVASASCSIRPGKSMTFSVDLTDGVELEEDDLASIARMFDDYMAEQLGRADALGIPIMPK